uniref:Uncharacterized protein n=1 Tax=Anguilla anguilla TaxID=7936 RepID=A0A0E9T3M2_ANGAN
MQRNEYFISVSAIDEVLTNITVKS